jgi:hypothetical protein
MLVGSSNLDTTMRQATLVIGWVGPALFDILLAALIWGAKVLGCGRWRRDCFQARRGGGVRCDGELNH